jgi:hypothetical protein
VRKPLDKNPMIGRGSVRADEVLTLREFGRRLGLASRALCDCQRGGLRTVLCGRVKFVIGADALDYFRRLADAQASGEGNGE